MKINKNQIATLLTALMAVGEARAQLQLSPVMADVETTEHRQLSDGNSLDRTNTGRHFRDRQGRTRLESGTTVAINDPVAHIAYLLDTKTNVARRFTLTSPNRTGPSRIDGSASHTSPPTTNLGTSVIDGFDVIGQQTLITIPAGSALGNKDPIHQTVQVWSSQALRLPILTISTDPVNGVNTQRYKNIRQDQDPDPALFQVPPGWQVVDSNFSTRPAKS